MTRTHKIKPSPSFSIDSMSRANAAIKYGFEHALISVDLKTGKIYGKRGGEISFGNALRYPTLNIVVWDGKQATIMAHRVVGYALFGDDIFDDGLVIDHINGDTTDFHPNNLQLITKSHNTSRSKKSVNNRQYYKDYPQYILEQAFEEVLEGYDMLTVADFYYIPRTALVAYAMDHSSV